MLNKVINLSVLVKEILGKSQAEVNLVTREIGKKVRNKISFMLNLLPENSILTLDFFEVGIIDYSCADEIIAKLITRLIAKEYGDKYIKLVNLAPSQIENIEVALMQKKLATLLVNRQGHWKCIGMMRKYLFETLEVVMNGKKVTARELSEKLNLELNTSSTRLINLYKSRLVVREEELIVKGGRQFIYHGLA